MYLYRSPKAKHVLCLGSSRQPTSQAQEQAPPPGLPCNLCQHRTSPDEHARLGGFCSERHRWEWSVVILILPRAALTTKYYAFPPIRDSRRNQNQWQNQDQPQQHQSPYWQNPNRSQQNQIPSRQNQTPSWPNQNQPQRNQNQSRRMS